MSPTNPQTQNESRKGLVWTVGPSKIVTDAWCVEAIDHDSEGEVYGALFTGPGCQERAEQYAQMQRSTSCC
jgi:hypothetical protein